MAPANHRRGARVPGIVLVGGSGPGPRSEYLTEARAFAAAGIAALVYDKRTVGYDRYHRDFGALADDAAAGIAALRRTPGVDPDRVGLWGFSEGGWVAPLAALKSGHVAFLVTLGGPGVTPLRAQAWSLNTALGHGGAGYRGPGSLQRAVAGPGARLLAGTGLFPSAAYDPVPLLERMRMPVLALWGAKDVQVPPADSARIYRAALARAGNTHLTVRFLAGAAHNGRATRTGFDRIGGPVEHGRRFGAPAPGYLSTMTAWVRRTTAGRPAATSPAPVAAPRQAVPSTDPGSTAAPPAVLQLAAAAALIAGFAAGVGRRASAARSGLRRCGRALRWCGTVTVAGTLLLVVAVYATQGRAAGPALLGEPVPWLVLQVLGAATVVLAAAVAVQSCRAHAPRAALPAVTGAAFLAWAAAWSLLPL
ncbi:hypothetical protein BIV57_20130 [Mangrovactinospora gilvigrisea]|uniref:Alpha/beta hydrolase n=1 Tax=Mangrovactinospora gilvigrisea TaxID=1428644 RepID=A0A1J7BQI6_9ACTN|nr:alpha/beta hydrolase [Mangrovactinospora gilvigrisea]OIV35713.1 hypothetical protein BIV57_20130 [Mangrovactinospora gilvigrisea]